MGYKFSGVLCQGLLPHQFVRSDTKLHKGVRERQEDTFEMYIYERCYMLCTYIEKTKVANYDLKHRPDMIIYPPLRELELSIRTCDTTLTITP